MSPTRAQGKREFERVALVHIHALYNMALKLTRHPADAEDLLQETYLRAFRFWGRFEPGTNAKAWLFKILRNTFINRYRRAQRSPESTDTERIEAVASDTDASETASPERDLLARSLDAPIEAALRELSPEHRMVLVLAAVEDFSYKEIAAAMECPIGTVMSRLHRARKHLQTRLVDYARDRRIGGGSDDDAPSVRDDVAPAASQRRPEIG